MAQVRKLGAIKPARWRFDLRSPTRVRRCELVDITLRRSPALR